MKLNKQIKKIWRFIWEDDSVLSWIVNIILAFVIIKFLVYPGLGFMLNTSHPIVAVVSGSMEHKIVHPCEIRDLANPTSCIKYDSNNYEICGKIYSLKQKVNLDFFWESCGSWYLNNNITKKEFNNMGFRNGFNKGDIMILFGTKPEKIEIGDIIVFRGLRSDPIIHRVVKITNTNDIYYYQTKGDHNEYSYEFEAKIQEDLYIGRAVARIPLLGYIKILAVDLMNLIIR